jgi:hypothetical protein
VPTLRIREGVRRFPLHVLLAWTRKYLIPLHTDTTDTFSQMCSDVITKTVKLSCNKPWRQKGRTAASYSVFTFKPLSRDGISRTGCFLISFTFYRHFKGQCLQMGYICSAQAPPNSLCTMEASLNKPCINVFNTRLIVWHTVFCSEKRT